MQDLGYNEYETTELTGIANMPMYMTVIFVASVSTIITEISKEVSERSER